MTICLCGCGTRVRRLWVHGHNRRCVPPRNRRGFTQDARGYRYIWVPQHPRANKAGYYEEHRLIVEKRLGRYLYDWEDVHHINGVKNDNRDENLDVMSHGDHARLTVMVAERCSICDRPHKARGLCGSCYGRYYRSGREMPLAASRGGRWGSARRI
jgi:hypothetical protein